MTPDATTVQLEGTKPTNSTWGADNAGHEFVVVLLISLLLISSFITPAPQKRDTHKTQNKDYTPQNYMA